MCSTKTKSILSHFQRKQSELGKTYPGYTVDIGQPQMVIFKIYLPPKKYVIAACSLFLMFLIKLLVISH